LAGGVPGPGREVERVIELLYFAFFNFNGAAKKVVKYDIFVECKFFMVLLQNIPGLNVPA
jgi:hypothetical protein